MEEESISKNLIENCLLNLKIIAKLEENDKLITTDELLKIDKPIIFQGIRRWYTQESREVTMNKLNNIYTCSFNITDNILRNEKNLEEDETNLDDSNSQIFQKFIIELTNSLRGIDNLKTTYKEDVPMISQLDMISSKLNTRLEKMNKICRITYE